MAHTVVTTVCDLYPNLKPRQAAIQAHKDGLIKDYDLYDMLQLFPNQPVEEPKQVKKRWTLLELREVVCPWEGKPFKDLTNDQLDANVDAYDEETKQKALAYLEMRGFK